EPAADADEPEVIAARHGAVPSAGTSKAPRRTADEQERHREEAGVQDGVPRREERVVDAAVRVRPPVEVEAAGERRAKEHRRPVEARHRLFANTPGGRRPSNLTFGSWSSRVRARRSR